MARFNLISNNRGEMRKWPREERKNVESIHKEHKVHIKKNNNKIS